MKCHIVGILALAGCFALSGCAWKDFRDYCDECLDGYSEDGCKAVAKAEFKYAKSLGCKKEFKDYASCIADETSSCSEAACLNEARDYFQCTCRAESSDRSDCDGLNF